MSTDESRGLEFRGRDLEECQQFIAAIIREVHAQGKLWEDEWIADYVAIHLAGDAVIWWSALDEETQRSWRLLRQAMISRYRPIFYGGSSTEAEHFVFQIHQRALNLGKLRDPSWIAAFVSGCFAGSALRWYSLLEPGVRSDWELLRRALFVEYSENIEGASPTSPNNLNTIPTPASALAGPDVTKSRRRGRIRVQREKDTESYYLSKACDQHSIQPGRLGATVSLSEALEVEYESLGVGDGGQILTIPDNQIPGCDVLGMKWYHHDMAKTDNCLALCGVDSRSGLGSPSQAFVGPLLKAPWKLLQVKEKRAVLAFSQFGMRLFCMSRSGNRGNIWFRTAKLRHEVDVELFFEPV